MYVRQGGELGRDVTLCFYRRLRLRWFWAPQKPLLRGQKAPERLLEKLRRFWWRLQLPFEPRKKIVVTLDALDVQGRDAVIDLEFITANCGEAFTLISDITKKFGSPAHLDFYPLEKKRSAAREHNRGVTHNSNAPPPLKPRHLVT